MDLITEQLTDGFWGLLSNRPLMTKNEILSLVIILLQEKPEVSVELGCYTGGASRFISRLTNWLYCVDNFSINGKDVEPVFYNVMAEFDNITLYKDTTTNVANIFKLPIDFLFVDGDHSEHGIKTDCTNWIPKVKSGGIIAFHDCQPQFQCVIDVVNQFTAGWEILSYQDSLKIVRKP